MFRCITVHLNTWKHYLMILNIWWTKGFDEWTIFFHRIARRQGRSTPVPGCHFSRCLSTLLLRCVRAGMWKDFTRRLVPERSKVCAAMFTSPPSVLHAATLSYARNAKPLLQLQGSLTASYLSKNGLSMLMMFWWHSLLFFYICHQVSLGLTQIMSVLRFQILCWKLGSSQWTNASTKCWSCSGTRWV